MTVCAEEGEGGGGAVGKRQQSRITGEIAGDGRVRSAPEDPSRKSPEGCFFRGSRATRRGADLGWVSE